MTAKTSFPTFECLFDPQPLYLPLLSLVKAQASAILATVQDACRRSPQPATEIAALLSDTNWRAHLIGAVATMFCPPGQRPLGVLWAAVDGESWVSPQLVVVAYYCDPDFVAQARARVERSCGPSSTAERAGKTLAVLVHLCGRMPSCRDWLSQQTARAEVRQTLAADIHQSADIAAKWAARLEEVTREFGLELESHQ